MKKWYILLALVVLIGVAVFLFFEQKEEKALMILDDFLGEGVIYVIDKTRPSPSSYEFIVRKGMDKIKVVVDLKEETATMFDLSDDEFRRCLDNE